MFFISHSHEFSAKDIPTIIFIFTYSYTTSKNKPDKHNDERNANKHVSILKNPSEMVQTSVNPLGIMFVEFFCEKYLLDMDK